MDEKTGFTKDQAQNLGCVHHSVVPAVVKFNRLKARVGNVGDIATTSSYWDGGAGINIFMSVALL